MSQIAVCVADAQFFLFLRHVLAMAGFDAVLIGNGDELLQMPPNDIAAIVLEQSAEELDIASILAVRASLLPGAAIIALSRKAEAETDAAFTCDLFMRRPFDPNALLHFLHALQGRSQSLKGRADVILTYADIEMNVAAMTVRRAGRPVHLSPLHFRLLRRLLEEPMTVRGREDLIASCWPGDVEVEPRTVDIHIGHIRRALMAEGSDMLRTVRGHGYALRPLDETQ